MSRLLIFNKLMTAVRSRAECRSAVAAEEAAARTADRLAASADFVVSEFADLKGPRTQ